MSTLTATMVQQELHKITNSLSQNRFSHIYPMIPHCHGGADSSVCFCPLTLHADFLGNQTSHTINKVQKYRKNKDLQGHCCIIKYHFISGHQTCHLTGDVLSKHLYKSKSDDDPENEWSCSIITYKKYF